MSVCSEIYAFDSNRHLGTVVPAIQCAFAIGKIPELFANNMVMWTSEECEAFTNGLDLY